MVTDDQTDGNPASALDTGALRGTALASPVQRRLDSESLVTGVRAAVMLLALAWSSLGLCGEIHDAAKCGDLGKVQTLLKENHDLVFSKDNDGATPLHLAALLGHKDVAALLLANKAEANAKDNRGWTPLHWAAAQGHKGVAELLLDSKAEVNAKDNVGRTPLHMAAYWSYKDVAELLLANKAEVNAKNTDGETPLHMAVARGHEDLAKLLCQHGGHE